MAAKTWYNKMKMEIEKKTHLKFDVGRSNRFRFIYVGFFHMGKKRREKVETTTENKSWHIFFIWLSHYYIVVPAENSFSTIALSKIEQKIGNDTCEARDGKHKWKLNNNKLSYYYFLKKANQTNQLFFSYDNQSFLYFYTFQRIEIRCGRQKINAIHQLWQFSIYF